MNFVFMFTRDDATVEHCLALFDTVQGAGVGHMGFKDLGVDHATLAALNGRIKAAGGTSYMELVSTADAACRDSARFAAEIGVDRLLGGSNVETVLDAVADSDIACYPFPGRPLDHPTRLGGSADDIAADCRRIEALGCPGVDLLAYRSIEADPLALVRAARGALTGELIVAGSIDRPAQVRALADAGVDAFTIGTAALDGAFSPGKSTLGAQLGDILAASR